MTTELKNVSLKELTEMVAELQARVTKLETLKNTASEREMTDDDARSVLFGELKDTKHKDAAQKLHLSYGQIYSCRLGYTFKTIHKEMADKKIASPWLKA